MEKENRGQKKKLFGPWDFLKSLVFSTSSWVASVFRFRKVDSEVLSEEAPTVSRILDDGRLAKRREGHMARMSMNIEQVESLTIELELRVSADQSASIASEPSKRGPGSFMRRLLYQEGGSDLEDRKPAQFAATSKSQQDKEPGSSLSSERQSRVAQSAECESLQGRAHSRRDGLSRFGGRSEQLRSASSSFLNASTQLNDKYKNTSPNQYALDGWSKISNWIACSWATRGKIAERDEAQSKSR